MYMYLHIYLIVGPLLRPLNPVTTETGAGACGRHSQRYCGAALVGHSRRVTSNNDQTISYTCICMYTHIYIYCSRHEHMYLNVSMCIYVYVFIDIYIYIYIYIYAYI